MRTSLPLRPAYLMALPRRKIFVVEKCVQIRQVRVENCETLREYPCVSPALGENGDFLAYSADANCLGDGIAYWFVSLFEVVSFDLGKVEQHFLVLVSAQRSRARGIVGRILVARNNTIRTRHPR